MLKVDCKFTAPDLEKLVMKAAAEAVTKKVEKVRCPVHGQYAHVTVSGSNTKNLSFRVNGCCKQLIDQVQAGLS
jgi:hypothetical protein